MVGDVYLVDSPYFTQADESGAWSLKNVTPGEYQVHAWHETSLEPVTRGLTVRGEAVTAPDLALNSDRPPMSFVPDKAGKPRQTQLGYSPGRGLLPAAERPIVGPKGLRQRRGA